MLKIENPEAEELARQLAKKTGKSVAEAVVGALRESLAHEPGRAGGRSLGDQIREIGRRCAALPDRDQRTADEILGYDEIGVPR